MAEGQADSSFSFKFLMGLRGFHHYRHAENWQPFRRQLVRFKRELDNEKDRFAVAGHVRIQGRAGRVTVGHVPRELSRYIWHALLWGCEFKASVKNPHYRPSPLMQGGLEIEIEVEVYWGDEEKCNKLKEYLASCNYPGEGEEYSDDSKDILKEILGDDEEISSDEDMTANNISNVEAQCENDDNDDENEDDIELPTGRKRVVIRISDDDSD